MVSSGGHFQTVADDLSFPSTNVAATCTLRGASNAAATTYTATTVIDADAGTKWDETFQGHAAGSFGAIAAGDTIVTSAGFWGVVVSTTGPGTVTVDKWRSPKTKVDMNPASGFIGTPADATQCAVFSPMHNVNSSIWRIERINLTLAVATETLVITDPGGNVKYTITIPAAAANTLAAFDFGPGLEFPYPFGVKSSGTTRAIVSYSIT